MTSKAVDADSAHHQRRRQITKTALTGILAKAAMFLPTILIAWVAVPHLGAERYGVLMTVLSLMGFLNIADLGVGGSLITALSRESGAGNTVRVRQLQANGFAITFSMAILIFVVGLCLDRFHIGAQIFRSSAEAVQREGTTSIFAFFVLFALTLPLALAAKIQLGLQHGHVANYWQAIASLVNFACGALAAVMDASVPIIIIGMMTGTVICGVVNVFLYYKKWSKIRPKFNDANWCELKTLLKDSGFYLTLQIIFAVAYTIDTVLVARFLGAEQASIYSLIDRLFSIVAVAVSVVTAPLWVAYGDALGSGDRAWAIKTLKVSTIRIFGASCIVSISIFILLQPLMQILSRGKLVATLSLGIAMAVWRIIESLGCSISVFMFASKANKVVLYCGIATASTSLLMKIIILPNSNLIVMPVVSSICYLLFCLVPCFYYIRKILVPLNK